MVQLSKRLSAVAQLVTITGILADVGTDHGYIPVYLIGKEQIKKAIAMDVNQGPLERAQEHIHQYGLESRIETRLSDGLQALKPKEVEGIVIAGMGGNLMKRILMQGEQVAHTAQELILQPQSEVMEFRKFLWKSGYTIVAEDMVLEDGKYYPMMRVVYENAQKEIPDVLALKYGEKLLEQKHPVLKQYLLWQRMQKEKILGNLQKNAKKDVSSRKEEIEEELSYIAHALEKIDGAK